MCLRTGCLQAFPYLFVTCKQAAFSSPCQDISPSLWDNYGFRSLLLSVCTPNLPLPSGQCHSPFGFTNHNLCFFFFFYHITPLPHWPRLLMPHCSTNLGICSLLMAFVSLEGQELLAPRISEPTTRGTGL